MLVNVSATYKKLANEDQGDVKVSRERVLGLRGSQSSRSYFKLQQWTVHSPSSTNVGANSNFATSTDTTTESVGFRLSP